jgi:tetratricopeptide (TPR) repeat protein
MPTVYLHTATPAGEDASNLARTLATSLARLGYSILPSTPPEDARAWLPTCDFFLGVYDTTAPAPEIVAEIAARGIAHLWYVVAGTPATEPALAASLPGSASVVAADDFVQRAVADLSRLEGWRRPAEVVPDLPLLGREGTLTRLREVLDGGHRAVLVGPRGSGKSAVARALATSGAYPGGVFWVTVGDRPDGSRLRARLARNWALCHPELRCRENFADEELAGGLSQAPGPLLFVFDDVPHRDVLRELVLPLCPATADVLVTSRWPDVADLPQPWPRVHLTQPDRETAGEVLLRAARTVLSEQTVERAGRACNGHLLALRLAGSLFTPASAQGENQIAADLARHRSGTALPDLALASTERDTEFEPVFAIAYRNLSTPRQKRFRALGVVPPDHRLSPTLLRLLWEAGEPDAQEDAVETAFGLANAGLLERRPDGFQAHALVVTYARALLRRENEESGVTVRYLQACVPSQESPTEATIAHLHRAGELALRLVAGQARYADPAEVLLAPPPSEDVAQAEEQARAKFTPTELRAFTVAATLARAVLAAPGYAEIASGSAWPLVLAIAAQALGRREDYLSALARPEVAALPRPQVETSEVAEPEVEDAEAERRLRELNHLGWDHYEAGRWDQAEAAYREALQLGMRLGQSEGRVGVLNNWGELCRTTGRLDQALDMLERAYQQLSPEEQPKNPALLHNLGLTHRDRGDLERSRQFLGRAVEGFDATGLAPASLGSLSALAGVLVDLRQFDEAQRAIERGLKTADQHRLPRRTAEFRGRQGDLAVGRGNSLDALPHYQFALEEARLRGDRVAQGTYNHQMGVAYLAAGRPDLAIEAFRPAIELSKSVADHAGAAVSSALLGRALVAAGQFEDAIEWLLPVTRSLRAMGNRPHEMNAWEELAEALYRLGRKQEATEALDHAMALARELYGERGAHLLRVRFATQVRESRSDGESDPAGEALRDMLEQSRESDDRSGEAEALMQQSLIGLQRGDLELAVEAGRQAAELGVALKLAGLEGAARTNLGEALRRSERYEEAIAEFNRAIPLLADGNANSLADAHNNLALALMVTDRAREAIPHLQETVRLKRTIGRPAGAGIAERLLAQACEMLEQFADCAAHARAAAALFREAGNLGELPALYLMAANAWLNLEEPASAMPDLEQAVMLARQLRSGPELALALALSGFVLGFHLGRTSEGAEAMEESIQLAEELGLGKEDLGGMTVAQLAGAVARLRAGDGASTALEQGQAAFEQGQWDDAIAHFSRALDRGGAAHVGLAAAACYAGQYETAHEHLATVLAADPDNPDALFWLAQVSVRQGSAEDGLRAINQAIAVRQRGGTLEEPQPVRFVTSKTGGPAARIFQNRQPLGITPDYLGLFFTRAQLAAVTGAHEAALADLALLLELQPNRWEYYHLRARILRALGQPEAAVRDLYQVTELEPYERDFYVLRGDIFVEAGDPGGALEDYGWGLRLDPKVARTWSSQGFALLAVGDFAAAAEHFAEAAALEPETSPFHYWGAVASALGGDVATAAAGLAHPALIADETGPIIWRALVALLQGDRDAASRWLKRMPDDPQVLFWLGVLARLREDEPAEPHFARAAEFGANLEEPDSLRLQGRLAVVAGAAEQATALYTRAFPLCSFSSLRLEIGYLDLLATWFPASPASALATDLRARVEARLTSQALQNPQP